MACVVCGGESSSVWGRLGGFEILLCRSCGVGRTSPAPSAAQLEENNLATYAAEERAAAYLSRQREFDARYAAALARIRRFKSSGSLLDVGCNIGMFMKAAKDRGYSVAGVELNPSCAAYGRDKLGLDIRPVPLERAGFAPDTLDVVTMFDVLEHVQDPRAFLGAARFALKPGGLLVVQSPNFGSLMAWLMKENWSWLTPPDHLYHFTPGSLSRLLGDSGFEVAELRTWEPAADFVGNIYSGFRTRSLPGRLLRRFTWLAARALVPLLQRVWWGLGRGGLIEVYALKKGG
ncbi:MAG: class I SAM-dependent methyltransferase [Elusimicrobiales bacterium]|nr:class I SAM-dependent methyltransferase [Elusimicrobiales bacterium]